MFTTTFKKFFDLDAPVLAPPAPVGPVEQPTIAALMAKQGAKSDPGSNVVIPVIPAPFNSTEKKEEPPKATEPPAATAVTPPASTETSATPAQVVTQPAPTVQKEPESVKVPSWQEVLKSQQPNTVLKELGYNDNLVNFMSRIKDVDPKMLAFLEKWENKDDVNGYLRELTTDYSKMSPEDLMRHQLRKDYPTANPLQLEALYKREVVRAYSLDSDDENDVAEGKLLLEAKADRYRDEFIKNQQNYLLPKPPEPKAIEPDNTVALQQKEFEIYERLVMEDKTTKAIHATNKFVIGEGDEAFNFPVDSNKITEKVLDSDSFAKGFFTTEIKPDGTKMSVPDGKKLNFVATYLEYGDEFVNAWSTHYKTLGAKEAMSKIENAKQPDGSTPAKTESEPKTPAEAMAKHGRFASR